MIFRNASLTTLRHQGFGNRVTGQGEKLLLDLLKIKSTKHYNTKCKVHCFYSYVILEMTFNHGPGNIHRFLVRIFEKTLH